MNPSLTVDDKHQISSLSLDGEQNVHDWTPCVGRNGITSIEGELYR